MKNKSEKIATILEIITLICGSIALVLKINEKLDYEDPTLWLLLFIVVSTGASLIIKLKEAKKNTKSKKR